MTTIWDELPRPFFILAPMEAVTDVVFRHVVTAAARPDVYFTEFTNATGWVAAGDRAIGGRLVKTDDESPIIAQLWGADPAAMEQMAIHCRKLGYDGIDLNMGCPDASAVKSGGGSGMIRTPELAAEMITAAKKAGLPVSVKTRLGYSRVDEWRDWLTHILKQDVVNLTIHLRTKKEMSKVDAHFELIPDIKQLRDDIAPQTLLTINGDIRDRAHGEALVRQHGVDGIMIGRGIFHNPFAFEKAPARVAASGAAPDESSNASETGADSPTGPAISDQRSVANDGRGMHSREELINLLRLQLDLHDKYSAEFAPRKFEPLKRFFKIYIRDFDGASELRDRLMHSHTTDEVRDILNEHEATV